MSSNKPEDSHLKAFWYIQESPTASGYDWLITEELHTQLLDHNAVLAYDDSHSFAAILDADEDNGHLTVNGQIVNWGKHFPLLMVRVTQMRALGQKGQPQIIWEPIINPMLAPGQTENNVVNKLDCGHELDTEDELEVGTTHYCSVHGMVMVIK
jgi:hypothetical protein